MTKGKNWDDEEKNRITKGKNWDDKKNNRHTNQNMTVTPTNMTVTPHLMRGLVVLVVHKEIPRFRGMTKGKTG